MTSTDAPDASASSHCFPKRIAITGASSGLGAALARAYAEEFGPRARLCLAGRSAPRLDAVAKTCSDAGAQVDRDIFDMEDLDALANWVARIDDEAPLDLAIANAGLLIGNDSRTQLESREAMARQISVNLTAACLFLRDAAERMRLRGQGRVVAVSSLAGLQPKADEIAYSASKAGLNAFCEGLREFAADRGVGVTLICPGFIDTAMGAGSRSPRPMEWTAERAARRILRSIERGRSFDAFPAPLLWSIRLGRLAPWRLRALVTRGLRLPAEAPPPDPGPDAPR